LRWGRSPTPRRIRESQIEQVGDDAFVFRYVIEGGPLREGEKNTILEILYARLGKAVKLGLVELAAIPRDANGKFRQIIGLKSRTQAVRQVRHSDKDLHRHDGGLVAARDVPGLLRRVAAPRL